MNKQEFREALRYLFFAVLVGVLALLMVMALVGILVWADWIVK